MGVPQNRWFIMETPIKMDDFPQKSHKDPIKNPIEMDNFGVRPQEASHVRPRAHVPPPLQRGVRPLRCPAASCGSSRTKGALGENWLAVATWWWFDWSGHWDRYKKWDYGIILL